MKLYRMLWNITPGKAEMIDDIIGTFTKHHGFSTGVLSVIASLIMDIDKTQYFKVTDDEDNVLAIVKYTNINEPIFEVNTKVGTMEKYNQYKAASYLGGKYHES